MAPVVPRSTDQVALRLLGLREVVLTDGWWARWQHDNRAATTPHALTWLSRDGSVRNLVKLHERTPGEAAHRGYRFSDSDVYKVLEAMSWDVGRQPDADVSTAIEGLAEIIGRAQQSDG
jgi:DUF1680 family protein